MAREVLSDDIGEEIRSEERSHKDNCGWSLSGRRKGKYINGKEVLEFMTELWLTDIFSCLRIWKDDIVIL